MRAGELSLFCIITSTVLSLKFVKEKDFDDVRLDKDGYEKVRTLHYNWYLHGIKAIMGQLGKDLWKKLDKKGKNTFYHCLDQIPDRRDIVAAAQCLLKAREGYLRLVEERKRLSTSSFMTSSYRRPTGGDGFLRTIEERRMSFTSSSFLTSPYSPFFPSNLYGFMPKTYQQQIGSLTVEVLPRPGPPTYQFHGKLPFRYEDEPRLRRINIKRAKRSPYRLIVDSVSKSDSHGFTIKNMAKPPSLKKAERSAVQRITGLVKTMAGINETQGTWSASYNNVLKIKKAMDRRAKDPGARVYDMRMLDLVLDRRVATTGARDKPLMPPLVQEAYDLLAVIDKSKGLDESKNIKFLSPRFAPVMPDKTDVRGKLSPSILSFYNDEGEDQIAPIPKLLEATGMSSSDRELILETVMELSGAKSTVNKAMNVLEKMNLFGMEGELKDVTERIAKHFKELEKSFTFRQQKEMKKKGFTFLESNQLEDLYSKQGILRHHDLPVDVEEYKTLSRRDKEKSLWLRIEQIASNLTDEEHYRTKRQALVSVLKPTVLAPYMFTPIYGLSVLGPTVLSPSLFSPLILNPAVLSPYVLSPAVGMPFILSPYLLSPYVLSPLVMAPFILTPYVLSPNVINPYVLSPLILSPLVLCPDVLSPMVLGGGILSPGVASPAILSKSVLMASVLSPSVLS